MRIAKTDTGAVARAVASINDSTDDSMGVWMISGGWAFTNAIFCSAVIGDGGSLWFLMGWTLLIPVAIYAIILLTRTDYISYSESYRPRAFKNYLLIPKSSYQKPIAQPLMKQIALHSTNGHPGSSRASGGIECDYCAKREEAIENLVPDHLTSDEALNAAQNWIKHRKEIMG